MIPDLLKHYKHGKVGGINKNYICFLYIRVRYILNINKLRMRQHTGESTAYADFESSSFMRFLPIPVLAVDSVIGSSGKF